MKDELSVGVIGVGQIGIHHARIAATTPSVRLAGIADIDVARRGLVEEKYGVRTFKDFQDLLPDVDAVVIAVPASQHGDMTSRCLEAGKHVLVEKPFALSCEEGRRLIDVAAKAGVILQVGYVEQFNPVIQTLQEVIAGQPIRVIEAQRLCPYEARKWDIDVVSDLMVHDLSLLLTFPLGDVIAIQATGSRYESEHLDYAMVNLRFSSGALARCSASRVTPNKVREITVTTPDAYIQVNGVERKITVSRHTVSAQGDLGYKQRTLVETLWIPNVEPLRAQFEHFVTCIREGNSPKTDGCHGLKVLDVVERIRENILSLTVS